MTKYKLFYLLCIFTVAVEICGNFYVYDIIRRRRNCMYSPPPRQIDKCFTGEKNGDRADMATRENGTRAEL